MKKSRKRRRTILIMAFALLFGVGVLGLWKLVYSQLKPARETPGFEMRRLLREFQSTASGSFRVPILLYHYVEHLKDSKDTIRRSLNIDPDTFEKQIQTLSNAGYTFMTARELGEVIDGKTQLPANPILLTIDDGHWDVNTVILPILKKYNVKATAYIIPGFLGGSDFMTKQQLQEVINSGLVEIGAHTVHHIGLKGKLFPIVKYEIFRSKTLLEENYHIPVVSFAYPSGQFDSQAIALVKEAGFSTAVSTIAGVGQGQQNRFFLYRLRPGYRTGQALLNYLTFKFKI